MTNILDILAGIALALIFFFFTWFLFLLEV
jgi:hypothetical protein